jgi:RNA 2',3'-cyclic 3'-phosphodiesterase
MKTRMRLFTGLDLPAEVVRNLEQLLRQLRGTAHINWSPPANLHITTKFIGEWPEERLSELQQALGALPPRAPIPVHVRGVGFFPNPHSPRNFWCGIDAPGLAELAADTDRATAALGIAPEKRAFSPHLTLARIKERLDLQPLREAIAAQPSLEFGRRDATGFFLYRSQLKPTGSVYTKLAEFPFSK